MPSPHHRKLEEGMRSGIVIHRCIYSDRPLIVGLLWKHRVWLFSSSGQLYSVRKKDVKIHQIVKGESTYLPPKQSYFKDMKATILMVKARCMEYHQTIIGKYKP